MNCEAKGCSAEAVLGWGSKNMQLCLAHFEAALKQVSKVRAILEKTVA